MKIIKGAAAGLGAALLALTLLSTAVHASGGVDAGFTVWAVLPDNQLDAQAGYFDLQIPPGENQTLSVLVQNPGGTAITVQVEALAASTNRGGLVSYISGVDTTRGLSFPRLAATEEDEYQIPPGGSLEIPVAVTMPEEEHQGLIMGAIRVLKLPEEDEEEETGIQNLFSYIIGVRLRGGEVPSQPEFALEGVELELVNHKASLVATVRNTRPVLAEQALVRMQVYTADGDPVIERTLEDASFAPDSVLPMTLTDQAGYGFAAGDYLALLSVELGGEQWEFEHPFTLEQEETAAVNSAAVNQWQREEADSGSPLPLLLLAAAIVAAAAALPIGMRLRKR